MVKESPAFLNKDQSRLASKIMNRYYDSSNIDSLSSMIPIIINAVKLNKINEENFDSKCENMTWSEFEDMVNDQLRLF